MRVRLDLPFKFIPLMKLWIIHPSGQADMRLENNTLPTLPNGHLSGVSAVHESVHGTTRSEQAR